MYGITELLRPESLDEALALLCAHPDVRPLAGGTDVLIKLRHSNEQGVRLMDLSRLHALRMIVELPDGNLQIGPLCTFTDLAESEIIARRVPMLKTAALSMGGPQIQNVATIGGNVCNGATSADSAPSLFALGAVLTLKSASGARQTPITAFYAGPGRVRRESGELLTAITLPLAELGVWGGCYQKFSTRKAMDISTLGCAAVCSLAEDGSVRRAAIALGTAGPTPVRCSEAEAYLTGRRADAETLAEAGRLAVLAGSPRTSWRASKEYRAALIETLARRAFAQAHELAKGAER